MNLFLPLADESCAAVAKAFAAVERVSYPDGETLIVRICGLPPEEAKTIEAQLKILAQQLSERSYRRSAQPDLFAGPTTEAAAARIGFARLTKKGQ